MSAITDFYQFKYSKNDYYIDLFINRAALYSIEEALDERLSNQYISKDAQCAYMRLKELFQSSRCSSDSLYVDLRINKCYLKYIKNLYYYFSDRKEYSSLKALNDYLQVFLINDIESISSFSTLNEDIKVRVLSNV
ncbi:MAG: hypothetical protein ACRCW0_08925 [Clostridium sp.]|uniref:Uncharacterized protein n=1 Tax=Romboutsia lituseburensis DSM 797 TaxID=1121325 RepID=A0A1G9P308_9FIRM|nr:hypothetical protein [Romboutsia lituseburensis]CEH33220.1 Hypothetical protein RLITU_0613 [Romboutsia lituseburensis]SDL93080.1 hypothetical protein SAMN04515677_104192 [Romboutsia lituseburensis DSM 797]